MGHDHVQRGKWKNFCGAMADRRQLDGKHTHTHMHRTRKPEAATKGARLRFLLLSVAGPAPAPAPARAPPLIMIVALRIVSTS